MVWLTIFTFLQLIIFVIHDYFWITFKIIPPSQWLSIIIKTLMAMMCICNTHTHTHTELLCTISVYIWFFQPIMIYVIRIQNYSNAETVIFVTTNTQRYTQLPVHTCALLGVADCIQLSLWVSNCPTCDGECQLWMMSLWGYTTLVAVYSAIWG